MLFGAMIGQTITDLFSMDKNQDGNISRFEAMQANFDLPDEELEALIEDTTILIEKYISTGTELYGETVDLIGRYKVRYATTEVPAEFALPPAA
jgi:hypothetical protein